MFFWGAIYSILSCQIFADDSNSHEIEKPLENISLPWGGNVRLKWPSEIHPNKVEGKRATELRWEASEKTWEMRLALLAPRQAGFTLTVVKDNTQSMMVKSGLKPITSREETLNGRTYAVLRMPELTPYRLRELWMTETSNGIVGISLFSAESNDDAGLAILRSLVSALQLPTSSETLTVQQMREDLSQLTSVANSAWAWKEMRREKSGINLEEIESRLKSRIHSKTTSEDFGRLLKEFVAAMCDGHASLGTSLVTEPILRLPFSCQETDEGIIISYTEKDNSTLTRGDRLLSVRGIPVDELIADHLLTMPASTEHARRYQVVRNLNRVPDAKPSVVDVETIDGRKLSLTLSPSNGVPATKDEISHKLMEATLGYLRISSFAQDNIVWEQGGRNVESLHASLESKFAKVRAAFADLHDCRAIILDIRDNGGGSDLLGQFVARAFSPTATSYYDLATHFSRELLAFPEFASLQALKDEPPSRFPVAFHAVQNLPEPFSGKLFVLMNEGCFSATDCFLNFIVCERPDAVLVGMPNGAGAGAPRKIVQLSHSKASLTCCVMRVWNLHGDFIEGNAIEPTIRIRANRSDIASGQDKVLETAIDAFNKN